MKLSVNEAKLTGLWAKNCATIQQILILYLPSEPKSFRAPSRYDEENFVCASKSG